MYMLHTILLVLMLGLLVPPGSFALAPSENGGQSEDFAERQALKERQHRREAVDKRQAQAYAPPSEEKKGDGPIGTIYIHTGREADDRNTSDENK